MQEVSEEQFLGCLGDAWRSCNYDGYPGGGAGEKVGVCQMPGEGSVVAGRGGFVGVGNAHSGVKKAE